MMYWVSSVSLSIMTFFGTKLIVDLSKSRSSNMTVHLYLTVLVNCQADLLTSSYSPEYRKDRAAVDKHIWMSCYKLVEK